MISYFMLNGRILKVTRCLSPYFCSCLRHLQFHSRINTVYRYGSRMKAELRVLQITPLLEAG